MANSEQYFDNIAIHPIDIAEGLAEHHAWEFDRVADDQIAMAIEGAWRTYSITLSWSARDETLRMVCAFEMAPPDDRLGQLYHLINEANDRCWTGSFVLWRAQDLMVYRYGLALTGGEVAGAQQLDRLVAAAVGNCERFYPAFQLVCWGDESVDEALKLAMDGAYGTA